MAVYLKFFGSDLSREYRTYSIKAEIERAESHYVAGFSELRPPTIFQEGDIIYMGRMVKDPNDYVVFGKGIVADSFKLPRDRATMNDTQRTTFRKQWPYYLRLKNTVFINGTLRNGIEIEYLIRSLKYDAFERTRQWFETSRDDFSIRKVFVRQSYVELTHAASIWMTKLFDDKLNKFGQVDTDFLARLPKPEIGL